jgi:arylsulfatase A-like enzyme
LIDKGRSTIASILKESGYSTACLGKWHLGMNWQTKNGYLGEKPSRNEDAVRILHSGNGVFAVRKGTLGNYIILTSAVKTDVLKDIGFRMSMRVLRIFYPIFRVLLRS